MEYYNFEEETEKFPLYEPFTLPENIFSELKQHFDNKLFEQSQIFNKKTKQNETNETIRSSKKCSIKTPESFELINKLFIPFLNNLCAEQNIIMKLVEDELELIKYDKGDFFNKHHDFVNYVSDQM